VNLCLSKIRLVNIKNIFVEPIPRVSVLGHFESTFNLQPTFYIFIAAFTRDLFPSSIITSDHRMLNFFLFEILGSLVLKIPGSESSPLSAARRTLTRSTMLTKNTRAWSPGLPDGLFSNQKIKFG
jgi:hypothetical protein